MHTRLHVFRALTLTALGASTTVALAGHQQQRGSGLHAQTAQLPPQLAAWDFLIGDWDILTKRYSADGDVLEEETGQTRFTVSPAGAQLLEHEQTVLAGNDMDALHVFAVNPEDGSIEIARTDSGHHTIGVLRGVISADQIELLEKHPNPEHSVIRRVVYERVDDDHFTRRLYFSADQGETWFVRFEGVYSRVE